MQRVDQRFPKNAILSGRLAPGERIRQEAVADELSSSRAQVREALIRLENEGLINIEHNVGARVAKLDQAELEEIYIIHERVEPILLSLSVSEGCSEQISQLRELDMQMRTAAEKGEIGLWVDLDRKFHLLSYSAARKLRMFRIATIMWEASYRNDEASSSY